MAKSRIKLTIAILLLMLLVAGCTDQKINQDKDLTLPNFSFVGLSEPLADKANIKVSVHVKIPYTELQFTRVGENYLARYEVGVNILDKDNERLAGKIWSDSLKLNSYQDTRKTDKTVLAVNSFTVPAAELTINVRVTDLYTKKSRILTDDVDQSNMYSGELALGNILIMDNPSSDKSELLVNQSFYEIIDTLLFKVRLIGELHPYELKYQLVVKGEKKLGESLILNHQGAIDSLLTFVVPLTDMHFTNYALHLTATDGQENRVTTKTNFNVRIRGINFDVGDLDEAVKQLVYITTESQIREILHGAVDDELVKFREFWLSLDPTPGTTENELMDEYYRRVAFSIEAFSVIQEGWRSDRGMIYILFGPPDEIQRSPFEVDRKPYQVWEYYRIGKQFVFRDETGFGDYRLDQRFLDQNDWRFRY